MGGIWRPTDIWCALVSLVLNNFHGLDGAGLVLSTIDIWPLDFGDFQLVLIWTTILLMEDALLSRIFLIADYQYLQILILSTDGSIFHYLASNQVISVMVKELIMGYVL